jgi:serine/threonine protein kinase
VVRNESDSVDALVGTLLDGKYRIERRLAQGGMATVYVATQEPLGRQVAVKVLKHLSPDPEVREIDEKRFFREASSASKLTHPNTVIVHDYGVLDEGKGLFLVMEYLEGIPLAELLERVGHLTWERAFPIITQIAGSLGEAHREGLVHRDLKPLNVVITQKPGSPDVAKVLDFGLAKPMKETVDEKVTEKGAIIGSPLYMSPEQIFNEAVDHRSDIYALGILSFEMLTGRTPFVAEKKGQVRELLRSHLVGVVPDMRAVNPYLDAPPEVEFAIRRCLAKKADDRFNSIEDFVAALAKIDQSPPASSLHDTADFTHHQLIAKKPLPKVSQARGEKIAFSTTKLGSSDAIDDLKADGKVNATTIGLWFLAAVLALGIGVTAFVNSTPSPTEVGIPEEMATGPNDTEQEQTDATLKIRPGSESASVAKNTAFRDESTTDQKEPVGKVSMTDIEPPATKKEALRATINVTFKSVPSGAAVYQKGERLSPKTTPFSMDISLAEAPGIYTFKKRGFVPGKHTLSGDVKAERTQLKVRLSPYHKPKSQKLRRRTR